MIDFNQAIVLGNVTRDPELRTIPSGQSVISFSVATNRRWMNKDTQQKQEETEFHNVVAWGKLAEICNQILYKGRKVLVSGRLRTRNWEGQDGIKRYSTEIVADNVCATGSPKSPGESQMQSSQIQTPPANPTATSSNTPKTDDSQLNQNNKSKQNEDINLDDIPF